MFNICPIWFILDVGAILPDRQQHGGKKAMNNIVFWVLVPVFSLLPFADKIYQFIFG